MHELKVLVVLPQHTAKARSKALNNAYASAVLVPIALRLFGVSKSLSMLMIFRCRWCGVPRHSLQAPCSCSVTRLWAQDFLHSLTSCLVCPLCLHLLFQRFRGYGDSYLIHSTVLDWRKCQHTLYFTSWNPARPWRSNARSHARHEK